METVVLAIYAIVGPDQNSVLLKTDFCRAKNVKQK